MFRVKEKINFNGWDSYQVYLEKKNVGVAVLDSGIAMHPDFSENRLLFYDFIHHRTTPYDDNGHGTHICGIIGGNGIKSGGKYAGMVPGIDLVVGKVLDENGDGSAFAMQRGLDWVLDNKDKMNVRVLNISVGVNHFENEKKIEMLKKKLKQVWDENIVVICAAGNDGPKPDSISVLALGDKVIGVGCFDEELGYSCNSCAKYSGRGGVYAIPRKPDVVAPGTGVVSCCYRYPKIQYVLKNGTSMATAIVSGIVALAINRCPSLTNEEIKYYLTSTAKDLHQPWNVQGWGMVDADKFLTKVIKNNVC